ncbi:helix-turn-helix domain-containing protein [Bacillus spizizenii]|jgi:DNA-binding HxlR family transcriptional regulator|uniref:winged helix-turn-helix transcriptional regulator n=1 Tax=Bacillus spizizenii TaxID=96241 RepID=UPI00077247DA|nr:helix-turn-helix domain-containing protein [Bacillus spizizenii]KXJ37340.1 HxlR family transcriptional regulator [Bacillus spizizenii]MEC1585325.1 helix-turn-helix domain-containing protein [Bacillus spizizenii]
MGNRLNGFGACSAEVEKACPVEMTLHIIGGKWKGIIIDILSHKSARFIELKRTIPGITQRMLTLQLRELEADGVVKRNVENTVPKKVEYSLTELGEKLSPIIASMRLWGNEYMSKNE